MDTTRRVAPRARIATGIVLSAMSIGVAVGFAGSAQAASQPIRGPVAAVINSGGPGFGSITDTHNQNGLSTNYTSGVTNFDAYVATDPKHTSVFAGFEWFSNSDTTSASVTYDLGDVFNVDRLALWNEESSGIGTLDLHSSTDGVNFSPLSLGITPFDNPLDDYPVEVFSFTSTNLRFVRFDMSGCPQPDPGSFQSCAIGEVAFSAAAVGVGPPTDKEQCKNDGWKSFDTPRTFKNQGDCIQYVNTGK